MSITNFSKLASTSEHCYSFGCAPLDIALGFTGFRSGKVYEVRGPESRGKCLVKDTRVLTSKGLETIEEIFVRNDQQTSCVTREREIADTFINELGEKETTSHFTWNGKRSLKKITTRSGNEIKATHYHPLRVIDTNGFIVWKKVKEITSADHLVSFRGYNLREDSGDLQEAQTLGYLIADGCFTNQNRIAFTNSNEEAIENYKKNLIHLLSIDESQIKEYPKKESKGVDFHFNSNDLCPAFYEKYNIKEGLAKDKVIPYIVRTGSKHYQRMFIQSFMDLEGSILKEKTLEVVSASKELMSDLKLMLQTSFGIIGFLNVKPVQLEGWDEPKDYYKLVFRGLDFKKYVDRIGFSLKERLDTLSDLNLLEGQIQTNHDSIPNLEYFLKSLQKSIYNPDGETSRLFDDYAGADATANLTLDRWEKIKQKLETVKYDNHVIVEHIDSMFKRELYFDSVGSIEDVDEEPTFDFTLPETSSFIANGICSHNSTLGLEFVFAFAEHWQKLGKEFRIKWIETESAFDATRTIWMRPDIGHLIEVEEAETVEEAHECMRDFLRECTNEGKYGIIVWDTLAAASTTAQKSSGDQYAGGQSEQARYLRWMFKDIVPLLAKAGAPLILPNQTYLGRAKMAHLPPPVVSYGGGAIKYYSSVRVDIQESTKPMKEVTPNGSETEVGIITKNKLLKNKITGVKLPFNLWINNENGLDKLETTLGFMKEAELIKVSGSWKKMNGYDGKEFGWRSTKELRDKITHTDPKIKDWLDYKVYAWYASSSPLVKLRIIEKVWAYEKMFFGEKRTELSEQEALAGVRLQQHLEKQMELEEKKEAKKETKKRTPKVSKTAEHCL